MVAAFVVDFDAAVAQLPNSQMPWLKAACSSTELGNYSAKCRGWDFKGTTWWKDTCTDSFSIITQQLIRMRLRTTFEQLNSKILRSNCRWFNSSILIVRSESSMPFLLTGAKVPSNFRSRQRKFQDTCSREQKFLRAKVPVTQTVDG